MSIDDNSKLAKLINKGFETPIYWNEYKITPNKIVEIANANDVKYISELLDSSCQVLKDYLCLRITIHLVIIKFLLINIKNTFYQELKQVITILRLKVETFMINQLMIQLSNIMKLEKYQLDHYTIGCLLDCSYFEKNYRLVAADLRKQKALDADSRATQQIIFTGTIKAAVAISNLLCT